MPHMGLLMPLLAIECVCVLFLCADFCLLFLPFPAPSSIGQDYIP